MKQIILIILLFTGVAIAQNWTSVKETNVWVGSALNLGVDIFTNGTGNHIIVQRSNQLKYFRMNVNGTATDSVTIESTSVVSPSITGDASIIYIVYRKSNESSITAKYSTDGGLNWSYIGSNPPNSNAIWIESIMSNGKLHVTYQVSNSSLYRYYTIITNSWSTEHTVSSGENGIYPRITAWYDANDDKVYFIYKKLYTSDIKWREFNVATSSWTHDPQLAISHVGSTPVGLAVTDSRITVYYNYFSDPYWYFQWIIKNKSNNSTISTCLEYPDINAPRVLYSTVTYNYNVHVSLWYNYSWEQDDFEQGIYHSNGYDCSLNMIYWNNFQEEQNVNFINCSSSSNDVYVIWQDSYIGQNLRLIYDDQAPLAPKNLTAGTYTQGNNIYARLTWQLNNEPDVYINQNAFEIWRRIKLWDNPWSSWAVVGYKNGNVTEFIDYEIIGAFQAEVYTAQYKIRAKDINNHYSSYSNVVTVEFRELAKITSEKINFDYNLEQNYPNPFNPTTTINYSLKTAGEVTLKVYDILGTEVASLVNERQEEGSYNVEFNASELPSGIYFYTLTSENFMDTKKLILLK
jgi:hypothetical protein